MDGEERFIAWMESELSDATDRHGRGLRAGRAADQLYQGLERYWRKRAGRMTPETVEPRARGPPGTGSAATGA